MPDALERRLDRIESKLTEVLVNLTTVENRQTGMIADVRAINAELGGAPEPEARGDRDTIRWRIHKLENDELAAKAAHAALASVEATREQARLADENARRQAWSVRQKVGLFVFAGGGFVFGLLRLIGIG